MVQGRRRTLALSIQSAKVMHLISQLPDTIDQTQMAGSSTYLMLIGASPYRARGAVQGSRGHSQSPP